MVSAQDEEEKKDEPSKRPSWSSGLPERQATNDLNKPEFKPEIDNSIELDMSEFGIQPKAEIELDLPIQSELPMNDKAPEAAAEPAESTVVAEPVIEDADPEPVPEPEPVEQVVEQPIIEQPGIEQPPIEPEDQPVEAVVDSAPQDDAPVDDLVDAADSSDDTEPLNSNAVNDSGVTEQNDSEIVVDQQVADDESTSSLPVESSEVASTDEVDYKWVILKQTPVKYPVKAAMDNLEGWVDVEVTINPAGEVVSAAAVKYSRRGRVFGKPAVQSVNDWLFEPPSNTGINNNLTRIYKLEFNL